MDGTSCISWIAGAEGRVVSRISRDQQGAQTSSRGGQTQGEGVQCCLIEKLQLPSLACAPTRPFQPALLRRWIGRGTIIPPPCEPHWSNGWPLRLRRTGERRLWRQTRFRHEYLRRLHRSISLSRSCTDSWRIPILALEWRLVRLLSLQRCMECTAPWLSLPPACADEALSTNP